MADRDLANDAQLRAACFGLAAGAPGERGPAAGPPPLLIIAGAGTGKTKTLAMRVARLVLAGTDPERILLLTFSRRAAEEMRRRAGDHLAACAGRVPKGELRLRWAGTFHSIGHRLLRIYATAAGLDPGFSLLDRSDAADLMDGVREQLDLASGDRRFPRKATCLDIYSRRINTELPLGPLLQRHFPWCAEWEAELKALYLAYLEAKQEQAALDYDDLLLLWERLLGVPELAAELRARFDHVLVDEYQDTNALQARILRALRPDGHGLTVVGDDAQAIYGFRGGEVGNILNFPHQHTPPAAVLALTRNYRSVQGILDLANALMAQSGEAHPKTLVAERGARGRPRLVTVADEVGQARYLVGRILAKREAGVPLVEQAVLFRTGYHSALLELELARANIPFVKWGGLRFLEAAHVKDVMALLRWAENPKDRLAASRVLQLLPGIGPGTARRILERLHPRTALADLARVSPPAGAAALWPELVRTMLQLAAPPAWPDDLALVRRFYEPLLLELHDDPAARLQDLDQLTAVAAQAPDRRTFLAELTLDPAEATGAEAGIPHKDEEQLVLSTIHSAKGQEWRCVYLMNLVDGCIPSDMATGTAEEIAEERRLLYVAITRAKDELELIVPSRFHVLLQPRHGDRHVRAIRSRFITGAMLALCDQVGALRPRPGDDGPAGMLPRHDLVTSLRRLWE